MGVRDAALDVEHLVTITAQSTQRRRRHNKASMKGGSFLWGRRWESLPQRKAPAAPCPCLLVGWTLSRRVNTPHPCRKHWAVYCGSTKFHLKQHRTGFHDKSCNPEEADRYARRRIGKHS